METIQISLPEKFFLAYVECALWSSNDIPPDAASDDELERVDLDAWHGALTPEALTKMREDCQNFLNYCQELGIPGIPEYNDERYSDDEKSGHDFWLTRNGHGVGYWDRGLGDLGEKLSDAAKTFGSADLYIGDDGNIHHY